MNPEQRMTPVDKLDDKKSLDFKSEFSIVINVNRLSMKKIDENQKIMKS